MDTQFRFTPLPAAQLSIKSPGDKPLALIDKDGKVTHFDLEGFKAAAVDKNAGVLQHIAALVVYAYDYGVEENQR